MTHADLYMKVVARAALLALLALNLFFVPGVHGSFPVPAPGVLVFFQEVTHGQEQRSSFDAPVIPVLPEFTAMAGVTLLWARLAKGTFFGRAWVAYLLACVAGTASRVLVPMLASQRLPFADLWLVPALVLISVGLLVLAKRVEARYAAAAG